MRHLCTPLWIFRHDRATRGSYELYAEARLPLPKYVVLREGTYYVRRPLPLDVQPAYGGRREIWRSLRTTVRREAEARSHGVLALIQREIAAKRRELRASDEERAFLGSDRFDSALRANAAL